MTATQPQLLADYFVATNAHDVAAMSAFFSEDAVVHDEGRDHRGLAAIRAWMEETIKKYDYQVDPLESSRTARRPSCSSRCAGPFPGARSPSSTTSRWRVR